MDIYSTHVEHPLFLAEQSMNFLEYNYATGGGSFQYVTESVQYQTFETIGDNTQEDIFIYDLLSKKQRQLVDLAIQKIDKSKESKKTESDLEQESFTAKSENLSIRRTNGAVRLAIPTSYEMSHHGNGSHADHLLNDANVGC